MENTATPTPDKLLVFSRIVDKENNLISQRMTWLMTLNGFVIGAIALLVANADQGNVGFGIALVVVSTLGSFSNLATYFSNYWAEIAIQEADLALRQWLSADEEKDRSGLLRLYGRDPGDQQGSSDASLLGRGRPLTVVLQPWFCLPFLFWISFVVAGLLATLDPMDVSPLSAVGPSAALSAGALILIAVESGKRRLRLEHAKGDMSSSAQG